MSSILSMYKTLPRNIFLMFFVKFINAFGDFVVPFLSLFLTVKLGYSAAFAASVVTATVFIQIPGALLGGTLADRFSKKGTYMFAQGTSAFCILLCAFMENKKILVVLLFTSAFFASWVKPVLNAFVYDLVGDSQRKVAYSFLYLGINLGVAVGPLLSGFLFNHNLTLFFIGDAFTSFTAVCLVAFFVNPPHLVKKEVSSTPKQTSFIAFFRYLLKTPSLNIFLLLNILLSFLYAQASFSLPLLLKECYPASSAVLFGTLMSINAITVVVTTTFVTYLTKNHTLLFNISCSGICLGLGFGLLTFPKSFVVFIISTILWTLGEVLMSTNIGIYVVSQVEPDMRTRSSAVQSIFGASGKSVGILSMGFVISHLGIHYVWPILFVIGIFSFLGLRTLDMKVEKTKSHAITINNLS